MKIVNILNDIHTLTVKAKSFPEGIAEAHITIQRLFPYAKPRRYFGMSNPEKGFIVYKAAAEMLSDDNDLAPGVEKFTIKKGDYLSLTVADFAKNPMAISEAFEKLIHQPNIDPQGYCLEWYQNERDVLCLVKMA
jgi:hypothetical protein